MHGKRGQIGLEYVMIVGAVLLVTIPLFFYAIYETNYKIRLNQADDAVNTLANAADTVYSMGPGSKKYVWVSIPSGVTSSPESTINENDVQLTLSIFGGSSDIHASSKAKLVGSVPTGKGTYRVAVESLEAGVVRIGEEYIDETAPIILRVYPDPEPDQLICPGFVVLGADTDEPATCRYDVNDVPETGDAQANYLLLESEFDGRGLTHISTVYTQVDTSYTFYARCQDPSGNTMESSETITFNVGTPCIGGAGPGGIYGPGGTCEGQLEDYDNPEITLQSPADWEVMTFPLVEFNFTVNDVTSNIAYCVVNVSESTGEPDFGLGDPYAQSHSSEIHETAFNPDHNTIKLAFHDKGVFLWNVFCVDGSCAHNQGTTGYRTLNVSKDFFDAFLTSCAGWCGWQGYTEGGICMLNSNKCDSGCDPGWTYDPDDTCYTGEEISEEYCQGEGVPPACCCLPNT